MGRDIGGSGILLGIGDESPEMDGVWRGDSLSWGVVMAGRAVWTVGG